MSGSGAGEGGRGRKGRTLHTRDLERRVHEIGRVLNGGRTGVSRGVKLVVGRTGPVTTQGDIEDEGLRAEHGAIYSGRKEVSERAAKAIATKSAHVMSQVDEAQLAEGSPHSVKAGASLVMSAGIASRVKNQIEIPEAAQCIAKLIGSSNKSALGVSLGSLEWREKSYSHSAAGSVEPTPV